MKNTTGAELPRHIAIIMDGNGRWAKKRGLARMAGHAAGSETFRRTATLCSNLGISYLTVYAFSTENWRRPAEEVGGIMMLLRKYLREAIDEMIAENVGLYVFGDTGRLPADIRELIDETAALSEKTTGLKVGVCINYGGRDDIVHAARSLAADAAAGRIDPASISEADISPRLYTAGFPDPDLVIRTSGEMRISNFLIWQTAYSEFYFTDVLWPDFSEKDLMAAIESYNKRQRRFGGV